MARGHKIDSIPECPLVVENKVETITKTKDAVALLKSLGAYSDVEHSKESRKVRSGKGKLRNRRHVQRRGPLVIYNEDEGIVRAFHNISGVQLCSVERLNLLQLAPGGHLGRFCIWTENAFARLNEIYGTSDKLSFSKKGYHLPSKTMTSADVSRIIDSDEVQSVLRAPKETSRRAGFKANPLKNVAEMLKLNPYASQMKKDRLAQEAKNAQTKARKDKIQESRKVKKAFKG